MVKEIRVSLGLSQAEFARRYRINLATLKNWEQNRREPDAVAISYLIVIKAIPDLVAQAITTSEE